MFLCAILMLLQSIRPGETKRKKTTKICLPPNLFFWVDSHTCESDWILYCKAEQTIIASSLPPSDKASFMGGAFSLAKAMWVFSSSSHYYKPRPPSPLLPHPPVAKIIFSLLDPRAGERNEGRGWLLNFFFFTIAVAGIQMRRCCQIGKKSWKSFVPFPFPRQACHFTLSADTSWDKKNQHPGCLLVHISRFPFFFYIKQVFCLSSISSKPLRAERVGHLCTKEKNREGGCPHLTLINTLSGFGRRGGGREEGSVRPVITPWVYTWTMWEMDYRDRRKISNFRTLRKYHTFLSNWFFINKICFYVRPDSDHPVHQVLHDAKGKERRGDSNGSMRRHYRAVKQHFAIIVRHPLPCKYEVLYKNRIWTTAYWSPPPCIARTGRDLHYGKSILSALIYASPAANHLLLAWLDWLRREGGGGERIKHHSRLAARGTAQYTEGPFAHEKEN